MNRTVRACTVLALQITTAFPVVEPGAKGASGELDDPPFAVLLSSASQSSRLASPSERQLWRTLLVRALEVPWECYYDSKHPDAEAVHRLLHCVVDNLRPNPCAIIHGSTDSAQHRRERLSLPQLTVIGRFLELVLQHPSFAERPMLDLAAQSIKWCWADDVASAQAARKHHAALHSYHRQREDSTHIESQIVAIERAFAATPVPTGLLMNCGWDEPAAYELAFQGTDWRRLSQRLINHNTSAFSFMTPDAFRYFIPAVL